MPGTTLIKENYPSFAGVIKSIRNSRGISPSEFEEAIGCTPYWNERSKKTLHSGSHVYRWEKKHQVPNIAYVYAISKAFGIPMNKLCEMALELQGVVQERPLNE